MKRFLFPIAILAIAACTGADGISGSAGQNGNDGKDGAPGAPGAAAVVNYDTIYTVVRAELPAIVRSEIAKLPAPGIDLDSVARAAAALVPAGKDGATGPPGPTGATGATGATGPAGGGAIGNVIEGDLLVRGHLCVFAQNAPIDAELCASLNEMSIIGQGANISLVSNWYGTDAQYPGERHQASMGLDPDGGIRIRNNLGRFANADRPFGFSGFDSQSEWSWYQQAVGKGALGTQSLVLRTDWDAKEFYFASWRPGWKLGARTSTEGCMWCENLRFTFPTQ